MSVACTALLFVFGVKEDLYRPPASYDGNSTVGLEPTQDYGEIYIDQMLFFSDSIMFGITQFDIIKDKDSIITGRGGDMPLDFNCSVAETNFPGENGKAQSIVDIVSLKKPQYLLISIGLNNGVEHCAEEKFKQYYTKLIDAITATAPQTKIILQSVFPVSKEIARKQPDKSNQKIDEANEWIEELCSSLSVRYLNTAEALKNDKGHLKPEFDSGDGLHLNQEGYKAVIDYIKTHGYK